MNDGMERTRLVHGITLLKWIVIASIIAFFAFLIITSPRGNPRASKHRLTISSLEFIKLGLERYYTEFGEYPEPANPQETVEIEPGKVYRIGGAKCLYQALTGDGFDAIKALPGKTPPKSDGVVNEEESRFKMVVDTPQTIWRKIGENYFLVDAFGRPFQYINADKETKNTINSTYDLWSYGEDDKHVTSRSKDTEANIILGAKWIKNW